MADAPPESAPPTTDAVSAPAVAPEAASSTAAEQASPPRRRRFFRRRYLPLHLLLVIALLFAALHVAVDLATDRENILIDADVAKRGDSRELVVLLHGYTLDASALDELRAVVEAQLPDADILAPSYDSGIFSNIRPQTIAEHLRRDIRFACYERETQAGAPYERVFLVGHSLGAVLLRKAYLDELEATLPVEGDANPTGAGSNWATRVDRLILMAGMNRGWSLDYRPRDMRRWRHFLSRLTHWVGRLSWTGYLIRGAERGAPFVGDLRIQWVRAARHPDLDVAPVFQMLGLKDDIVSRADNMDLSAADNFTFIDVPAGHRSIITFPDTSAGNKRRAVFTELISQRDTNALGSLGRDDLRREMLAERDDATDHIIFLMHGIRDDAEWVGRLQATIQERAAANPEVGTVRTVTSEYGYFPMGSFLISPWRNEKARWFIDRYTEELARATNPNVKISFIGHSNGTYVLAKSLQDYKQVTFHNVFFAGSVVPKEYPWDEVMSPAQQRVQAFRNDRGAGDWVVAIFPHLFEQVAATIGVRRGWLTDIGTGGFIGFEQAAGHQNEHVLVGGHGAGIVEANFTSIADFILTGEGGPATQLLAQAGKPNPTLRLVSKLAWLVYLALLLLIMLIGTLIAAGLARLPVRPLPRTLSWTIYLIIVFGVLQTV